MDIGYVKIWRKIQDWEWFKDTQTLGFFTYLILNANYKDSRYMGHEVPRGALVCGRKALARELGLGEKTIRTLLTRLKSTNEVAIKTTNRFSIVFILNYNKYQDKETNEVASKTASDWPTTGQQVATSKEVKNINIQPMFDTFYSKYPKKQGRAQALKAFLKISPNDDLFEKMLGSVEAQSKSEGWQKDGGKYIPMPSTWLNGKRWEDEVNNQKREVKFGSRKLVL